MKRQVFLGDDGFIAMAESQLSSDGGDLNEIPRTQRRAIAKSLDWYENNTGSRNQRVISAYASGDYSMKQVADWFGVHYSTVSRVVRKETVN